MVIQIKTFDGFDIQDATYSASFPYEGNPFARESSPIVLPVIGGYARDEGFEHRPASFHILINVRGTLTIGMESLKQAFRVGRSGELVVDFDGDQRGRTCRVEAVYPWAGSPTQLVVNLIAADPRWHALTETEDIEAVTATGQQWTVTNDGNATVDDAVFTITPTAQKAATAAWLYRQRAIFANRVGRPLSDWPIAITLDHAALVTATKSQADGDDVRVLVDGKEVPRWFHEHADHDANDADSMIWICPKWSAMREAHLLDAISDVSPADGGELLVLKGETKGWPQKGYLLNEDSDEVISYDGWTDSTEAGYAAFQNIKRARWGTTAAAGSAGDHLLWLEHGIQVIYGYSTVAAPDPRPDLKPLIDLTSTTVTNLRHEWDGSFYDDQYPTRPGGWTRALEARDSHFDRMFLPSALGGAAGDIEFEYVWWAPPVGKDNYNVVRREVPVGTDGTVDQLQLTRAVDLSLALDVRGRTYDGTEVLVDAIRGLQASGAYSSTFLHKLNSVSLYAHSQVMISNPENAESPLSASPLVTELAPTDTGGTGYQILQNDSDDVMTVRSVALMVWIPTGALVGVTGVVYADDGAGAADETTTLGGFSISAGDMPTTSVWTQAQMSARPLRLRPGQTVHIKLLVGGGTHGAVYWKDQQTTYLDVTPMHGIRLLGNGPYTEDASAEQGDNVTVDGIGIDFDAAGVPYEAVTPEAACYWLNGTLTNTNTLQSLRFGLFVSPDDEIEVDCGARTVTNLTTGEEGLIYGVEASDRDQWINLGPGTNTLQWDEAGVAGVEVVTTFRSRWE